MSDHPTTNKSSEYESRFRETELVLKVTKEIMIKFIENGRLAPSSFKDVFNVVFDVVNNAVAATRCATEKSITKDRDY